MVPRSCTPYQSYGSGNFILSHCYWLATTQDEATNTEQFNAWQTIQRSHAVANGVHVVSVNRTGKEGKMQFWADLS